MNYDNFIGLFQSKKGSVLRETGANRETLGFLREAQEETIWEDWGYPPLGNTPPPGSENQAPPAWCLGFGAVGVSKDPPLVRVMKPHHLTIFEKV